MTQPIHLIGSTYAVEVPEDAHGLDINKYGNGSELNYWLIAGAKDTLIVTDLPPGNWQIICTEGELMLMHELQHPLFKEWFINFTGRNSYFTNRVDSLRSLVASKDIDPDKTLIIKKVS